MRLRALILLMLMSMLVTACGSGDDDSDDDGGSGTTVIGTALTEESPTGSATSSTVASPGASPDASSAASPDGASPTSGSGTPVAETEIPDTPVGERIAWVLETLNSGASDLTPEMVEASFTADVLAQLPADQLIAGIQEIAAAGPYTFEGFVEAPTPTEAAGLITSAAGDVFVMVVMVEEAEPYRMTALNFQPAPTAVDLASWDDFDTQLAALATDSNFLAAEIVDGECVPVHALRADARLAIGSGFKLYVLGELARKIEAGEASWDDQLGINDTWKSLPSGIMQDEPAGAAFSLQRFAELMISISDNTATDHLLRALGRENVEAIQAEMGHGDPAVNVPMLTTREWFALKLVIPQDRIDAYLAATDTEQREFLGTEVANAELSLDNAAAWTSPRQIDTIEWFASPEDMCRAMLWLNDAGQRSGLEPLRDILSINPAVPVDASIWPWVGFKGGSEPGVLNMNWLLERADGRTFVLSTSLNDQAQLIDEAAAASLMMGAMNLLAAEE